MKPTRAPFMPVTSDIDDDKLERLAQEKGVASLVKPAPAKHKAGEGAQRDAPTRRAVSNRSEMKAVNLELPVYAWTELKIRAAREQVSVRHIVMTALRGHGIDIKDVDMTEDGRRARGGHAPVQ